MPTRPLKPSDWRRHWRGWASGVVAVVSVIDPAYRHAPKRAVAGNPIEVGASFLKWYDLAPASAPVDPAIKARARTFVADEAAGDRLALDGDSGFVILHRCGADFYFLLVSVWRGNNELWEAVYYRDSAMPGFARFDPAYPATTTLRPTYCVWELGIVASEAAAWTRLLHSERSLVDQARWLADRFSGDV